ncbi:MAG: ribbon-helix-helix protein, CopG family [Actinomycetota bacterium]|nr:MAG: hypothetical protein FD171_1736 [Actinomycetota bacterium]MDO8950443.1 ribbon-helix-helix protein, CopG family [Actinomycetota bacterium]MDP3630509.1 ribbon-helix-helix protein, CopG family [Actinomycetota bacterium]
MTAKITISLPDELLAQLDAEAYALATSRSQLVQESVATYLGKTHVERDADARRERILGAIEKMRHFGEGREIHDDRPSLEILRELRDNDDFGYE